MKIAIAQINPRVGDVPANLETIKKNIESAKRSGARLILFPELALVGYPPRDLLDYPKLVDENLTAARQIIKESKGIAVVCGYVERNPKEFGKRYFNAAFVADGGEEIGRYYKQLLPYYDVFEDERYFEAGNQGLVVSLDGEKIALTICEDVWNSNGFTPRKYASDPLQAYYGKKIDLLVNLSASPFHVGKSDLRLELFKEISNKIQAPVAFCNQVGANDELVFDGSSFVMGKGAGLIGKCQAFKEDLQIIETKASAMAPVVWPSSSVEAIHLALTLGIKDYVKKSNQQKVCLGLSGGIDSSVVAVLARDALGSDKVHGVCLPTRFSSTGGLEDAQKLARNLKISSSVVPIEDHFLALEKSLTKEFNGKISSLTLENVQPRIRMTILMAIANETNSLLLNTSNKSEIATGFATLYGDSSGALGVLGDLTKHEVYELARFMNRNGEVIPESVIERVPTAELRENQTDQDVLPPYNELDQLVAETVEALEDPRITVEAGISAKSVSTFLRLHALSEYKRRQLPPVLRVSPRAFGMGRRIPITSLKPFEL